MSGADVSDSTAPRSRVWYGGYGSNLLAERFGYYLSGGSMDGHAIGHAGARDSTPAAASRSWRIPHQLKFGGVSQRWQSGGVCFVDPAAGSGETVVRLWNVTTDQFDDIAAQENQMAPGSLDVDHETAIAVGHVDVADSWYGRVLFCGNCEGLPVLTFTALRLRPATPPGPKYLTVVGRGLVECGLSEAEATSYLLATPGVSEGWTESAVAELLSC